MLPTPDASMLLELSHTNKGWLVRVLSLDEAADPPLFRVIKDSHYLPVFQHLPQVSKDMCLMVFTACS